MRISPLPQPWPSVLTDQFARIMPPGIEPLGLFTTLARSPRAWDKFKAGALLDGGLLTMRSRELVILRTCALAGCEYEWGVHISLFAARAGIDHAEIARTLDNLSTDDWAPEDIALVKAAEALHQNASLSDEEFADLSAFFDTAQILEILMLAGYYRTISYLCGALALQPEPFAARFDDYRSA